MAYPLEFRNKVRDAWLAGKFDSIAELCRHFGINKTSTVYLWRRTDHWDEHREKLVDSALESMADVYAERLHRISDSYYRLWNQVFNALALHLVEEYTDSKGVRKQRPRQMSLKELELLSRIIDRSQKGHRLSIGADNMGDEVHEDLEIVFESLASKVARSKGGELEPLPDQDEVEDMDDVVE